MSAARAQTQATVRPGTDLAGLLAHKKVLVVCGSGGVGKTTSSAALALAAAQRGRRVLVLTIDPARRLAASLGLSELDNEPRRIDPALFEHQGLAVTGELWAMMLDTKRTFDAVVERYAPRAEVAQRILANPIYQQISDALAGTQEYMAMEQLYLLTRRETWDLIVVDTPPTQHALDFLDAPERMIDVLDSGVVQKVFGAAARAGKSYLSFLRRGTQMLARLFERITGGELFGDMADFFESFDELYAGFRSRSAEVQQLLKSPECSFLLVTSPQPSHVQEARYFLEKIGGYGVGFGGAIVNRVHCLPDGTLPTPAQLPTFTALRAALRTRAAGSLDPAQTDPLADSLRLAWQRYAAMAQQDQAQIAALQAIAGGWIIRLPYFEADIHDLAGLDRLNRYLLG